MASSKKTPKAVARVKFKDLKTRKNPKGGAVTGWDLEANKAGGTTTGSSSLGGTSNWDTPTKSSGSGGWDVATNKGT